MREHTKTDLNRVLMGKVPDRGGRPTEIEAPPPEVRLKKNHFSVWVIIFIPMQGWVGDWGYKDISGMVKTSHSMIFHNIFGILMRNLICFCLTFAN